MKKIKALLRARFIKAVKPLLYKVFAPLVFKIFSLKKINPKLVVFADEASTKLPDNMTEIYDRLKSQGYETRVYLKRRTSRNVLKDKFYEMMHVYYFSKAYAQSKCLVLTDYYYYAYANKPRKGQEVIQLWHGCGAFKKWGYSTADSSWGASRKMLEKYPCHNTYTYVSVSAEEVKKHYAEAFNCSEDIIHADGVPRTDKFFDKEFVSSGREKLLSIHPEIGDRKIILYSPTFRGASRFKANIKDMIDFSLLKKELGENYVIAVKLHPFIKKGLKVDADCKDFVFDISKTMAIEDAMCASDMVISDYSSLIFEYALLTRPMIFFAYDLEEYDRERSFYYSYKDFVPGMIVRNTEEILSAIKKNETDFDREQVEKFAQKFMSACDGKSTDRIMQIIER